MKKGNFQWTDESKSKVVFKETQDGNISLDSNIKYQRTTEDAYDGSNYDTFKTDEQCFFED